MRCLIAEWPLLRTRLVRSRLGLWLALLVVGLVAMERYAAAPDPLTTALDAGALGAALSVGYLAGSGPDRRALALLLAQPTTPAAVACGRWLAATGGAGLVVLAVSVHSTWSTGAALAGAGAAFAGLATGGAVGACTLVLAWGGGNLLVGVWFCALALFGHLVPRALLGVPHPGTMRHLAAVALAVLPTPSHYRGVAWGEPEAIVHAAIWVGLGGVLATRLALRRRTAAR